ncbi:MAG: response regulator [Myxococcales bacterium]|nr:response regulator [Myxococcales bacterium]MCB9672325.1 response regulator [Alphaproteobacteria bacterium]
MSFDVLFVDDEPNVLSGIRRQLRRQFSVDTAVGPEEGLAKLETATYPVIVTDMRMPGMNGAEFLIRARRMQPHAVRMVLSGEASIDAAIQAVNDGSIFRYLRKPTDPEALAGGVREALERFQRDARERDLLEKTLGGAVSTLTEVLQLAHPIAFRTTSRVVRIATAMGDALGMEPAWELKVAASLVFIGCIAVSERELQEAIVAETPSEAFVKHAAIGQELLARIPRLENAAAMVGAHLVRPTREELEAFDSLAPFRKGAIVLGLAVEADRLATLGMTKGQLLLKLEKRLTPRILKALSGARIAAEGEMEERTLRVSDLEVGMIALEPIETVAGLKLVSRDAEITNPMRTRILNFHQSVGCREPVRVGVPRI